MIAYLAILLLQIACIVHVIKHRRNQMWIMALMFLPVASAAAYFVVEILPGLQGNRHVRTVRARAVAAIDPDREVRVARDALALADTAANNIRLGDAYADLGRHAEALPLYHAAVAKAPMDMRTGEKLARAQFETGAADAALKTLEATPPPATQADRDRHGLLRARILELLGRKEEALTLYADLVTRLPGEEGRCRYAALLIDQGWKKKARGVLEEVEARMKRLDRQQRSGEAEMYRWAMEQLTALRAR